MWTMRRSGRKDAEAVLRAQLDFAEAMVDSFAGGLKAYWSAWGALGEPAILVVGTTAEAQRRYLDTLRATLG